MVSEPRKQLMAWMETDYSKHIIMHFRWKRKWRLEHLRALGIMGEMVTSASTSVDTIHLKIVFQAVLLAFTLFLLRHIN